MKPTSDEDKANPSPRTQLALCIGSLAIIVALMYWSYVYPYPNGKVPDLAFFVTFWFKEIVALALALLVFLAVVVEWISKFLHGRQ